MELCEHGNSYHCQSCEIKYLQYVIEELQTENQMLKNAHRDRVEDIHSLENLLERIQRETQDHRTKAFIEWALTPTDM